jgi:hypothetical protein
MTEIKKIKMAEGEGFEPDSDHLSNQEVTDPEDIPVPTSPRRPP